MARTVEFEKNYFVLHLTGLTSVAALKKEITIPYSAIKKVAVENADVNLLAFRIGTSVGDIREGRFFVGDKWCFISYENHNNVIHLELEGLSYKNVIFQIDNPEEVKEKIDQHRNSVKLGD